jgi:hypothetical protein
MTRLSVAAETIPVLHIGKGTLGIGMKYFSAKRQAQLRVLTEGAYRDLAEKAVE